MFITDSTPPTLAEVEAQTKDTSPLPYGQEQARRIAFCSAQVRVVPELDWNTLREQSQLAERTREVNLELGQVRKLGAFPEEPYQISRGADGKQLGEPGRELIKTGRVTWKFLVEGDNEQWTTLMGWPDDGLSPR